MMNIKTLCWSKVASLPYAWSEGTATICQDRIYLGGGVQDNVNWLKSVLMCKVQELLQSTTIHHHSQGASPQTDPVWRKVAKLPVSQSALVCLQSQLLAVEGYATSPSDETSAVHQYDMATNSWRVVSYMKGKSRSLFAAILPNDQLITVGGRGPKDSVEIASRI